jgi:hypothetical protein
MQPRSVPSIVWVIGIVLGMVAFIALINGAFFGFTQIEGLASIVMLIGGFVTIRVFASPPGTFSEKLRNLFNFAPPKHKRKIEAQGLVIAFGVLIFAFTGFAFDQPGNVIYNLPVQWLFCPAGTHLQRDADVRNPRPGTTVITQDFTCVDAEGEVQVEVPIWGAMVIRFVEYLLLAYLLIWLNQGLMYLSRR